MSEHDPLNDLLKQSADNMLAAALRLRLTKSQAALSAEAERLASTYDNDGLPDIAEKVRESLGGNGSMSALPAPAKRRGRPPKNPNQTQFLETNNEGGDE